MSAGTTKVFEVTIEGLEEPISLSSRSTNATLSVILRDPKVYIPDSENKNRTLVVRNCTTGRVRRYKLHHHGIYYVTEIKDRIRHG